MQQAVELSQEGALWTGGIERSLPAAAGAAKKLRYEFRYDSQSQPVSSDRNASQESRGPRDAQPRAGRGDSGDEGGGGGRTRTSGTGLMRPLLYHLSYTARASDMVGPALTSVKQPGPPSSALDQRRGRGVSPRPRLRVRPL